MFDVREKITIMFCLAIDRDIQVSTLLPDDAVTLFQLIERNRSRLRPWIHPSALPETIEVARKLTIESFLNSFSDPAEALAQYRDYDPEVEHYLPSLNPAMEMGIWVGGLLAGQIMLVRLQENISAAEIGYWIDQQNEGHGIVTRCVGALMDYAIDEMGIERFLIGCAAENRRSRAIPERLGYRLLACVPDGELVGDFIYDRLIYEICSKAWREQGGLSCTELVAANSQPGGMIQ